MTNSQAINQNTGDIIMLTKMIGTLGVILLMITGAMGMESRQTLQKTFYVSPNGNDRWSGTLPAYNEQKSDGPFATIEGARDAIRQMKAEQGLTEPVTVMLRGGTYFLDRTIVFDNQDYGTAQHPITYRAYPGEEPVISGGRKIKASWETYDGQIKVCTLPEVEAGDWSFNQLFVNGERQTRARIPHEGYQIIAEAVSDTAFKYKAGHFKRYRNLKDAEIVMFHSWNNSRLKVAGLDEQKRIVRCLDANAPHPIGWSSAGSVNRYYIDNVFEGLQQPGDWYLDKHSGELYYWPEGNTENLEIVAPALKQLIRFEDQARHIHIRGITFTDTRWELPEKGYPDCGDVGDIVRPSTITYEDARNCSFVDNVIRNTGTYALEVSGSGNKLKGNEIYSTGSGGIITRSYQEERNQITYNHIHHCGEVYHSATGINIDDGGGLIQNNLIHDISHSGVYARHWATETQEIERRNQEQGLIISHNEIHHVATRMNDAAGIFIRDSNIVINNNLIHDVLSYKGACPGWGIYLGCETRSTKVTNNVVYRCRESLHVWFKNRNNTIINNIFADGGMGNWKIRTLSQIHYGNSRNLAHENIIFKRNIVYYDNANSELFQIKDEKSLPEESDYNVLFCTDKSIHSYPAIGGVEDVQSYKVWQKQGFDQHSIAADPLFVDSENDNYTLRPESPAFKVGFVPIDLSNVGLKAKRPR